MRLLIHPYEMLSPVKSYIGMVLSGSQILEYHPRWNGNNFSENSRKLFLFEILSCRTKSHLKNWQDPPEAPVRR